MCFSYGFGVLAWPNKSVKGTRRPLAVLKFRAVGPNSEAYCAVCDIITAQCPLVIAPAGLVIGTLVNPLGKKCVVSCPGS